MNVEERLTETLRRRAEPVEPSPDAWAQVRGRIDGRCRRLRWSPPTMVALAAVASVLAVLLLGVTLTRSGGRRPRQLATTDQPTPTTGQAATATTGSAPATTVATGPPERLTADSRIRLDGIGPVRVGMTAQEAGSAAGVPLNGTGSSGSPCTGLVAPSLPGVFFTITGADGPRIDLIRVSGTEPATLSGIRVGSTESEVEAAYPGRIESRLGPYSTPQLVYRAADPTLTDLMIVFDMAAGKVTGIRLGRVSALEMKEPCS